MDLMCLQIIWIAVKLKFIKQPNDLFLLVDLIVKLNSRVYSCKYKSEQNNHKNSNKKTKN